MPIYIPSVFSPLVWTENSWNAYQALHKTEMEYIAAYRDTIGVFALFSRKKKNRLRETQVTYRRARDNYYEAVRESL